MAEDSLDDLFAEAMKNPVVRAAYDKNERKRLAEELADMFIEKALANGSGSTLNDAWDYWEPEWQEDLRSTLVSGAQELLDNNSPEELEKPWESNKASDWIVVRVEEDPLDESHTVLDVAHRTFLEKHGYVDDREIRKYVVADIPEFNLDEIMESCFSFEGSVDEAREYVKGLGMTLAEDS